MLDYACGPQANLDRAGGKRKRRLRLAGAEAAWMSLPTHCPLRSFLRLVQLVHYTFYFYFITMKDPFIPYDDGAFILIPLCRSPVKWFTDGRVSAQRSLGIHQECSQQQPIFRFVRVAAPYIELSALHCRPANPLVPYSCVHRNWNLSIAVADDHIPCSPLSPHY